MVQAFRNFHQNKTHKRVHQKKVTVRGYSEGQRIAPREHIMSNQGSMGRDFLTSSISFKP